MPPFIVPPVIPAPAILHVIKHVINDDGRTAVAADFNLHVKTFGIDDVAIPSASGAESPGTTYTLAAGAYVVSEDAFAGYIASYSGDSDSSGNIILAPGDDKTVTITNDDIAFSPVVIPPIDVPRTVTGGQLPKTSTYLYNLLFTGAVLTLIGVVSWRKRKRYE
ncbi:MAG: LPXTG cell wall anchor domain-containing protein [Lutispora sp.]|nr:LPXTG cell wall anchor domain-containing protein [Lutispora sp.]